MHSKAVSTLWLIVRNCDLFFIYFGINREPILRGQYLRSQLCITFELKVFRVCAQIYIPTEAGEFIHIEFSLIFHHPALLVVNWLGPLVLHARWRIESLGLYALPPRIQGNHQHYTHDEKAR